MPASPSLNQAVHDRYLAFRGELARLRSELPLKAPQGYYPYASLELIPQILPLLDRHGVRLETCIADKVILDLGCGDGDLSFFFELFAPSRIIAIDWSPTNFNGLEGCRALGEALGSRVELLDVDIHSLDVGLLPVFDTAFCFGFLYHSPHPMWILQNLARRCRRLFLTTKIFDCDAPYAYFYYEGECNNDPTNWWCFTPKAVERMLQRAGFQVAFMERLDPHKGKSHPVDLKRDGRLFVYAQSVVASDGASESGHTS